MDVCSTFTRLLCSLFSADLTLALPDQERLLRAHSAEHPTKIDACESSTAYYLKSEDDYAQKILKRNHNQIDYLINETNDLREFSDRWKYPRAKYPLNIKFHEGHPFDSYDLGLHGVLVEDLLLVCALHIQQQFKDEPTKYAVQYIFDAMTQVLEFRKHQNYRLNPRLVQRAPGWDKEGQICPTCRRESWVTIHDVHVPFDGAFRYVCGHCQSMVKCEVMPEWIPELQAKDREQHWCSRTTQLCEV